MSWLSSILHLPGVNEVVKHVATLPGEDMSPEDRATEARIQNVLDNDPQLVAAKASGAGAAQLEALLRQKMPADFANWRLRESPSTRSGFRPTQAISKKRGAAYTALGVGGGLGGAALAGGFGPGAAGAAPSAIGAEGVAEGSALPTAGLGGALGAGAEMGGPAGVTALGGAGHGALGKALAVGSGLGIRALQNGGNPFGSTDSSIMPPETQQILSLLLQRMQSQQPLFEQATQQAQRGLPRTQ